MSAAGFIPSRFKSELATTLVFDYETCIAAQGKFKNLHRLIYNSVDRKWLPDDYFWFPDPDLEFPAGMVERLFGYAREHALDHFQPAFTRDSLISHQHLLQIEQTGHRRVPFLELACPGFSLTALKRNYWTFDLNVSGWGMELIWARNEKPILIDEITVHHRTTPIWIETRKQFGFPDPQREYDDIIAKYLP